MSKIKDKTVAVYLRVSTLDKQDKGLDSQERALKEYCSNHGFTNLIWYRDKVSGATTDRPAFNKLQGDIFAGKIGTVICWRLDRLSRSLKDGINLLHQWLKENNLRVIVITQQLDFSGSMGQIIASLLFGLAQMERETLRENTKRGLLAAKARGVKLGKRPTIFAKDIVPLIRHSYYEFWQTIGKANQSKYK